MKEKLPINTVSPTAQIMHNLRGIAVGALALDFLPYLRKPSRSAKHGD